MSLILEALKKSEQQRKLGEAPTLGSPVVATRQRRSLLPVLAILIVAAGATGWWLTRPSPKPAPPPQAAPVAATPKSAAPARPAVATPARPASPNPVAPNPAMRAPDRTRTPEEAAAMRAQKLEQTKRMDALAGATKATPPAAAAGASKAAPLPPLKAPPGTTKPGVETAPPSTAPAPVAAKTPIAVPPPTAVPPAATADKTATPPTGTAAQRPAAASETSVPTIWELPYSTRKDLPAIDLSMHVYSSDPKLRFVVIKGDRHAEGDELGQDFILREISQDGLVLEYKGQKFFYPRTGR